MYTLRSVTMSGQYKYRRIGMDGMIIELSTKISRSAVFASYIAHILNTVVLFIGDG